MRRRSRALRCAAVEPRGSGCDDADLDAVLQPGVARAVRAARRAARRSRTTAASSSSPRTGARSTRCGGCTRAGAPTAWTPRSVRRTLDLAQRAGRPSPPARRDGGHAGAARASASARPPTLCYLHGYSRPEAAAALGLAPKRMEKLMDGVSAKLSALTTEIDDGRLVRNPPVAHARLCLRRPGSRRRAVCDRAGAPRRVSGVPEVRARAAWHGRVRPPRHGWDRRAQRAELAVRRAAVGPGAAAAIGQGGSTGAPPVVAPRAAVRRPVAARPAAARPVARGRRRGRQCRGGRGRHRRVGGGLRFRRRGPARPATAPPVAAKRTVTPPARGTGSTTKSEAEGEGQGEGEGQAEGEAGDGRDDHAAGGHGDDPGGHDHPGGDGAREQARPRAPSPGSRHCNTPRDFGFER